MRDLYVPSDGMRREEGAKDGSNRYIAFVLFALKPILWLLRGVRFVAFAALALLEPVVSLVLWALSFLAIATAVILRVVGPPNFPFWGMLGFGLGCATLLALYYVGIRWLTPR